MYATRPYNGDMRLPNKPVEPQPDWNKIERSIEILEVLEQMSADRETARRHRNIARGLLLVVTHVAAFAIGIHFSISFLI